MSTPTIDQATAIRERMQRLRGRLDDRAIQLAASTEELLDWKTYAKRYPWVLVATGLVSGMVVAPAMRSKKAPPNTVNPAVASVPGETANAVAESVPVRSAGFISGFLHGTVSPMLKQFVWSYAKGMAAVHLESFLSGLNSQLSESSRVPQQSKEQVAI